MSRYDELCSSYDAAVNKYQEYKDECSTLIIKFRQHFIEYLACPEERVWYFRFGEEGPDQRQSPYKALRLDDAGFWNVGITIHVDTKYAFVFEGYLLRFRRSDERYLAQVLGKDFSISKDGDFEPCFEAIYMDFKTANEQGLDDTLRKGASKIGFGTVPRTPVV